jgi:hypothetical protein
MFSTTHRWTIIALVAVTSIIARSAVAADQPEAEPQTVMLRGTELKVWPMEDLEKRGFAIQDLPRDRNAAWLYIEAANTYPDLPPELTDAFDYAVGKAWPSGVQALDDYFALPTTRKAIDLATQASKMEHCQMPYFGDPGGSVIGVLLPNLTHMRQLSKIMTADGRRLAAAGNLGEAVERHLATMRVGVHAGEGFTLIEGLVGIAVFTLGNNALRDAVGRHEVSAAQLAYVAAELDRLAPRLPSSERGLAGEQRFGPAIVDEVASRPFNLILMQHYSGVGDGSDPSIAEQINVNPQDGWSRLEQRIGTMLFPDRAIKGHMKRFYEMQDTLARRPMSDDARAFNEEEFITKQLPRWDVLSRMMLPSLSRAIQLGLACKARFAITRTSVAVMQFTRAHDGEAPAALDDLANKLSHEAMIDPFTGDPLRYRREDNGWVLYSLGPNMKDDGGVETDKQRWEKFDIAMVFPLPTVEPYGVETEAGAK